MGTIKFTDVRKFETIELPSFKWSEVVIYTSLQTQKQREIFIKYPWLSSWDVADTTKALWEMLEASIKSWNFTIEDKDWNDIPMPITMENLGKLPTDDYLVLTKTMQWQLNEDNSVESKKKD